MDDVFFHHVFMCVYVCVCVCVCVYYKMQAAECLVFSGLAEACERLNTALITHWSAATQNYPSGVATLT